MSQLQLNSQVSYHNESKAPKREKPVEEMDFYEKTEHNTRQVKEKVKKEQGFHPFDFWNDSNHKKLLQDVLLEKNTSSESEDERGNPIFRKERCKKYQKAQQKLKVKYFENRAKIIEENKQRAKQGLELHPVPPEEYQETESDKQRLMQKEQKYKNIFYAEYQAKKNALVQVRTGPYMSNHDSTHPLCSNQLNLAISNLALGFDRRVEMAIIGQRQRRRYNQVRRLGLKIPDNYKRIFSVKLLPHDIQDTLLRYPHAITDDSDWEDDDAVLHKYKGKFKIDVKIVIEDPLKYVEKNGQRKREQVEQSTVAKRYLAARNKAGDYPWDSDQVYNHFAYKITDHFLTSQGCLKGMTMEKRLGTYQRAPQLNDEEYCLNQYEESVVLISKQILDEYPNIFEDFPDLKLNIINEFQIDRTRLKKAPSLIKALFKGQEIPDDLKVDEADIDILDENNNSKDLTKILEVTEADSQKLDKSNEYQQVNSEFDQEQVDNEDINLDQNYSQTDKNQRFEQLKEALLSSSESNSSHERKIKQRIEKLRAENLQELQNDRNLQKEQNMNKIKEEFNPLIEKLTQEQIDTLVKYYNRNQELRKLTRKEKTSPYLWYQLGDSAEESDDSVQGRQFNHPWLQARHQQLKQKSIPMKRKKIRRSEDVVNIDGVEQEWGQFKKKFYEDIKHKKDERGKKIDRAEFLLNYGDPKKEKKLMWSERIGFYSENSQDETTKVNRIERQMIRERKQKYSKPYLRTRKLQPFEKIMLYLGGKQILESIADKDIDIENNTVYDWQDPNEMPNHSLGNFLLARDLSKAKQVYQKEREMQEKVMSADQVRKRIFKNELIQIYAFFLDFISNSRDKEWAQKLKQILPKSYREYVYENNFDTFTSPPATPQKQRSSVIEQQENIYSTPKNNQREESKMISSGYQQNEYEEYEYQKQIERSLEKQIEEVKEKFPYKKLISPVDSDQEEEKQYKQGKIDQSYQTPPHDQQDYIQDEYEDQHEYIQKQSYKKDQKLIEKEEVKDVRQVILEKPQYVIPNQDKPDYQDLQKQMYQFKKSKEVDDTEEIKHIIEEQKILDPQQIEQKLVPKLKELISDSNGKLKDYFIWPHHQVGGMDKIYPNGRRYPKRLKLYQHQPENKAIYLGGVEVGYMIPKVPFLHPQTWQGYGVPLTNQTAKNNPQTQNEQAKNKTQQIQQTQRQPTNNNQKKRKFDQALNLGVGMDNYHKSDELFAIEEKLPFMRNAGDQNCPFEVTKIDQNYDNGQSYLIQVALKQNQKIQQKIAALRQIQVVNVYKKKKSLRLVSKNTNLSGRSRRNQKVDKYIQTNAKISEGSIWTLSNEGNQTLYIDFVIKK